MKKSIKRFLDEQLLKIKPDLHEIKQIDLETIKIIGEIKKNIKKAEISAIPFVGGSAAKNTMIKKNKYDIDIFIRFDKKYQDKDLSSILQKLLPKGYKTIHGSRDYFSIKRGKLDFEIIPTINVKDPGDARNITDLSYFHVNYMRKKISENNGLNEEIRLTKAFAYYQDCYGAESYINGFSGYAIELLMVHYKKFLSFLTAVSKMNSKVYIDIEKQYKGKRMDLEINESKLQSPIVLVDPTFKERNVLAALSEETFAKFKKASIAFLKNPSEKFFSTINRAELFEKKFKDVIKISISTKKQAGDIAGTKLKKFYKFFVVEVAKYFNLISSEFVYNEEENIGMILLSLKNKKELIISGPPIKMVEPLRRFKLEHKKIIIKKGRAFTFAKAPKFDEFFNNFLNEKSKIIEDMDISDIRIN